MATRCWSTMHTGVSPRVSLSLPQGMFTCAGSPTRMAQSQTRVPGLIVSPELMWPLIRLPQGMVSATFHPFCRHKVLATLLAGALGGAPWQLGWRHTHCSSDCMLHCTLVGRVQSGA